MLEAADHPDPLLGRLLEGRWRVLALEVRHERCASYAGESGDADRRAVTLRRVDAPHAATMDVATLRATHDRIAKLADAGGRGLGMTGGTRRSGALVAAIDVVTDEVGAPVLVYSRDATHVDGARVPTLAERISRHGAMRAREVAQLVRQLADALERAHAAGVVHASLSPSGILVDGRGGLHAILDAGVGRIGEEAQAQAMARPAVEPMLPLAPGYLSPEQARGERGAIDPRTDVFALAAVAWFALAGRPPFGVGAPRAVVSRLLHADPPPLAGASREIEVAVLRGLAKRREERCPSVRELAAALGAPVDLTLRMRTALRRTTGVFAALARARTPGAIAASPAATATRAAAPTSAAVDALDEEALALPRRRRVLVWVGLGIGTLGAMLGLHALASHPVAPPPPTAVVAPPSPTTVRLTFAVDPPGALVTVDGRPVADGALDVPRGAAPLHVTISAPGRRTLERAVVPTTDRGLTIRLPELDDAAPPRPAAGSRSSTVARGSAPADGARGVAPSRTPAPARHPAAARSKVLRDLRDPFTDP